MGQCQEGTYIRGFFLLPRLLCLGTLLPRNALLHEIPTREDGYHVTDDTQI